ncbi:MAG TPA: hypothetical protein VEA40_17350 [Ramlibacter sp.]|nr:hypothetical protein [Ramlibacter sp.]
MDETLANEVEVEVGRDGRAALTTPTGQRIEVDGDGNATLSITHLRAIGIENLPDLASHTIVRDTGGTTHQLEFVDGGTATLSYDENGKLRDFAADGCGMSLSADGVVVLKRYNVRGAH